MIVTSSPHIKSPDSVPKIMWTVNIALLFPLLGSIYFVGLRALWVVLVACAVACALEFLSCVLMKKKNTLSDGSAIITGILLAFNLPPTLPLWMVAVGSIVSIGIAKMCFGGLGCNIFNPALVGRAFLMACFPAAMTSWIKPLMAEAVSSPTPLGIVKEQLEVQLPTYFDLFIGKCGGCIGETSALLLIIGGIILLIRKCITWHIPVSMVGTIALTYFLCGQDPLFGILSGGVMLGAIFMATDMVTSPLSKRGQVVFGIGIGILTCIIRMKGGYPEGVSYSILLMNMAVPLIDRYVK